MTNQDLDDFVEVLRQGLPDNTCRTQLGLLLCHEFKTQRDHLRDVLINHVDVAKLNDETKAIMGIL